MNYMEQVANMLGVELGEEFQIEGYNVKCQFTKSELLQIDDFLCKDLLEKILSGYITIKKIPWKPKQGEWYFYINVDNSVIQTINSNHHVDILNIRTRNCFKLREEITPEIIKKYVDFFNDDERMIDI